MTKAKSKIRFQEIAAETLQITACGCSNLTDLETLRLLSCDKIKE